MHRTPRERGGFGSGVTGAGSVILIVGRSTGNAMKATYPIAAILLLAVVALSQDSRPQAASAGSRFGPGSWDPSSVHMSLSVPRLVVGPSRTFDPEAWRWRQALEEAGDRGAAERIDEQIMRLWQERWREELRLRLSGADGVGDVRGLSVVWSFGV